MTSERDQDIAAHYGFSPEHSLGMFLADFKLSTQSLSGRPSSWNLCDAIHIIITENFPPRRSGQYTRDYYRCVCVCV